MALARSQKRRCLAISVKASSGRSSRETGATSISFDLQPIITSLSGIGKVINSMSHWIEFAGVLDPAAGKFLDQKLLDTSIIAA